MTANEAKARSLVKGMFDTKPYTANVRSVRTSQEITSLHRKGPHFTGNSTHFTGNSNHFTGKDLTSQEIVLTSQEMTSLHRK